MTLKTIAILGSCVSRDNFNSIFNKNYKEFFEVVAYHHQSSILSLVSNPVPYDENTMKNNLNDFGLRHLKSELNKNFLDLLKKNKPDFLIIDFYGDLYNEVLVLDDNVYLTNNPKFLHIDFFKNQTKKIDINDNNYFYIWRQKVDYFFQFLHEYSPNTRVIVNQSRFLTKFKNGKDLNDIRLNMNLKTINAEQLNKAWSEMDDYVIKTYGAETLNMMNKKHSYYLNENHPWKSFYVHYNMEFYNDFFIEFQKLLFNIYEKDLKELTKQLSANKKEVKKLKKRVKFYENEGVIHAFKRYLLKIPAISSLNTRLKN